jgi:hypothetical protein
LRQNELLKTSHLKSEALEIVILKIPKAETPNKILL